MGGDRCRRVLLLHALRIPREGVAVTQMKGHSGDGLGGGAADMISLWAIARTMQDAASAREHRSRGSAMIGAVTCATARTQRTTRAKLRLCCAVGRMIPGASAPPGGTCRPDARVGTECAVRTRGCTRDGVGVP